MARRGRPLKSATPVSTIEDALELWNRALASRLGIKIMSQRANRCAAILYKARMECGHTAYNEFKVKEYADQVWVMRRDA